MGRGRWKVKGRGPAARREVGVLGSAWGEGGRWVGSPSRPEMSGRRGGAGPGRGGGVAWGGGRGCCSGKWEAGGRQGQERGGAGPGAGRWTSPSVWPPAPTRASASGHRGKKVPGVPANLGFPRVQVPASSVPEPSRTAPSGGRCPAAPAVPGAHGSDRRAVPEGSGAVCANMRKPDVKIVLLGDMNVGKTSLLQRYMERRFADSVSTVGGAFYLKQWRSYHISIWDTAGEGASRAPSVLEPRGDRARAPALSSVPRARVLQGRAPRTGSPGRASPVTYRVPSSHGRCPHFRDQAPRHRARSHLLSSAGWETLSVQPRGVFSDDAVELRKHPWLQGGAVSLVCPRVVSGSRAPCACPEPAGDGPTH